MVDYQWEALALNPKTKKNLASWKSPVGPEVIKRDSSGRALKVKFKAIIDNPETKLYIIGDFNKWGTTNLEKFRFIHDEDHVFCEVNIKIAHKESYLFLIKHNDRNQELADPATSFLADDGKSIFWDFDDPSCYSQKYDLIDNFNRSTKIIQTDLPGLIVHWSDKNGTLGHQIPKNQYYRFIADSGILDYIKDLGFNSIQFLPFAQSIDGDNWKFRYLVPFQFAINNLWGNPDDFARMIDACHEKGISVIGDFVIGHLPFKNYSIMGKHEYGIQDWTNRYGTRLFMKEETPWGTMRFDYNNPHIQDFVIASCIHFLKRYHIDGFRIDNVDGILRYGHNGDGPERSYGRKFMRKLNSTIYDYNPFAMIHYESHYFYKDNAKMLVAPIDSDERALGATAYNSSRMTFYLHTEYMPKAAEKITPWKFRHIAEEKEWGKSNSTIADFHNHDAAAGLMEMRCTGSYAYDTMTEKQPQNHIHAVGKMKVMEALISFLCEGRTLNLAQSFLLQTGTFEHDSSIKWQLAFNQVSNNLLNFKKKINEIMESSAFWPSFTKNRIFLNVDNTNKILVVERSDDSSKYIIVINLSSWKHYDYKIGLKDKGKYQVVLNSDLFDYSGLGMVSYPDYLNSQASKNFELLEWEVILSVIAPYGIIVLKKED